MECSYNPWSSWSATCGDAFRRRIQVIEEIELLRPSCDGLPLECPGDQIQEEKRKTPLCKDMGGEGNRGRWFGGSSFGNAGNCGKQTGYKNGSRDLTLLSHHPVLFSVCENLLPNESLV